MICIIPARGGSKRIHGKNIKDFFGKPMLAWTIDAARASGIFEKIVVSTESPEIAAIARHYGALVLGRPKRLSTDHAPLMSVMQHAAENFTDDIICCAYAPAPFLKPADLINASALAQDHEYIYAATEFPAPIERAIKGGEMIWPDHWNTRSQDLPPTFYDAGQFYFGKREAWLEERLIFTKASKMFVIPRWRAIDINTPEDWEMAEILGKHVLGAWAE